MDRDLYFSKQERDVVTVLFWGWVILGSADMFEKYILGGYRLLRAWTGVGRDANGAQRGNNEQAREGQAPQAQA